MTEKEKKKSQAGGRPAPARPMNVRTKIPTEGAPNETKLNTQGGDKRGGNIVRSGIWGTRTTLGGRAFCVESFVCVVSIGVATDCASVHHPPSDPWMSDHARTRKYP